MSKGAALIKEHRLFEARGLLEEIRYLLRRRVQVIIVFLSYLFMKGDWLYVTCFNLIGAWILSTFEEMYLNFSNSPWWTFWIDNSRKISTQDDALSKWLKPLYRMILGLCFAWKTFKTVNVNLVKSDKPVSKILKQ